MARREHLTILVDTLRELELARGDPATLSLTRLAARSNVPFDRFMENLRELQGRGLVTAERPYLPTPRGQELLRQLASWRAALRDAGLSLAHEP